MKTIAIAAAAIVAVALLVALGWRLARRSGKKEGAADERAQALKNSAKRRARADAVAAMPIPDRARLRAAWERYRRRRLRDLEGG